MENKKIKKIVREEMKNYVIENFRAILFALIYFSSWASWFYIAVTINYLEEPINKTIEIFVGIVMTLWFFINISIAWVMFNGD